MLLKLRQHLYLDSSRLTMHLYKCALGHGAKSIKITNTIDIIDIINKNKNNNNTIDVINTINSIYSIGANEMIRLEKL